MKRIFILLLITATLLLPATVQAVTGAVITAATVTTDKVAVTITTLPTAVDTSYVCAFVGTATDTTFVAVLDSTATTYLMTGLTERTKYIVFQLTRDGTGKTAISNKVTLVTYKNQIQDATEPTGLNQIKLYDTASWLRNDRYRIDATSWTMTGVGDTDRSMVFRGAPIMSLTLIGTSASDSISCTAYVKGVWIESESLADTTMWISAALDSVQLGSPGSPSSGVAMEQLSLPAFKLYVLDLVTYTDHVAGTIQAIITRNDYKD
jgi:hypothetical protein